ncbi:MAG TPA: tetratricopeptide repeat protein [Candidatus Magasanikbacteria bacterium]|nr:tetratricopeptide repeat protein [Candidatus Magasanikbacteria bacterium]
MDDNKCFENLQQGYGCIDKKEFITAERFFGKIIEAFSKEEASVGMAVQAFLGRSLAFRFQKKIDQTLSDLEQCLLLVRIPEMFVRHNIHFDIGNLLYQRNEPEKALKHFDAALRHQFSDNQTKVEIAKLAVGCCVLLEKEEQVVKYSKQGLLFAEDPFFHAAIVVRMKSLTEARAYAENILVRFPHYLMLRYYYAVILHQMGDSESCLKQLDLCLNKDPNFEPASVFKTGLYLEKVEISGGKTASA